MKKISFSLEVHIFNLILRKRTGNRPHFSSVKNF
ncbi:hypothetical protein CF65_00655 [Aggregatibacter actinomycetemcomitans HK1651]|nr:hypothetical protein CF65_00655 [Aggregatibacter actinomycetemcomitans HK1651]